MNRKEITKFLSELLVEKRLSGMGKYYASEVTMDWYIGKITHTMRRVDFIQFVPKNQTVSGIEHGDFYFKTVNLLHCKEHRVSSDILPGTYGQCQAVTLALLCQFPFW